MPPAIVLTAYGNIETAVQNRARAGRVLVPGETNSAEERWRCWCAAPPRTPALREKQQALQRHLGYKGALGTMVGTSPKMQEIFALLQQAGPSRACVLITGESGTGKEMVARTLHALSPRRQGPFVAINCAALPETLIESELFGHEKGLLHRRLRAARGLLRGGAERHAAAG